MLNIQLPTNIHAGMSHAVYALSLGHVSRYPIDVVVRPDHTDRHVVQDIYFVDSRFPIKENDYGLDNVIALFMLDSSHNYVVRSKRIKNDRYNSFSDGYHARKTGDVKKIARILKEVIVPFTDLEIAQRSNSDWGTGTALNHWKDVERSKLYTLVADIGNREVLKEVMHLKSIGVQFQSKEFQDVATHAEEALRETKRREEFASKAVSLYVFEQPDGVVMVTYLGDTKGGTYKKAHSWSYENIEVVPENIRQQIALLKISEIDTYVPEVGKRDPQGGYWVYVTPDKFSLPS